MFPLSLASLDRLGAKSIAQATAIITIIEISHLNFSIVFIISSLCLK